MNYRAVLWLLGCVLLLLAGFLLVPAAVGLGFGDGEGARACALSALVTAVLGGGLVALYRGATVRGRGSADFFRREGLAVVGLSWFAAPAVGALPFLFSGTLASPVDAFFESASGFTTTGSTILGSAVGTGIEDLGRSVAFWRSFTHWLGGIGIVLVFVVLFPTGGRSLFRSEVPGVSREAVQQRVRDSAITLIKIYVGLTAIEVGCLVWALLSLDPATHPVVSGWGWPEIFYDACVHSFGTLATGGFSTHGASVGAYQSFRVELIIVVFMFAAGVNFGLYDVFLRHGGKRFLRTAARSTELLAYVAMVGGFTALIGVVLWFWGGEGGNGAYADLGYSIRQALFNVVSVQTSTGYGTVDFDGWPQFARTLLMFIAFVGACAGSTGGGLKIVRFLILAKAALRGVKRFSRPRAIHPMRLGPESLDERMISLVVGYFCLWALVFAGGTLFVTCFGVDPLTSATAVLATLNNIGPGLELVGPTCDFGWMHPAAKFVLSIFMIVGRLEFYAVVVLFTPRFWRH